MLARLVLEVTEDPDGGALAPALRRLPGEFPTVEALAAPPGAPPEGDEVRLDVAAWESPAFDLPAFDARLNALSERGAFGVRVAGPAVRLGPAALEILTRCQRLVLRRNDASRGPLFDAVLAQHRALHPLHKPLVRADYDHALDTWQWLLRLAPGAGLAVQLAALFHDVERLESEADARVEHRAADYQAFKDAHAARGARHAAGALSRARVAAHDVARAALLVAKHERPRGDPDLDLLNDADALSFFSLNSGGFMDYYGIDHTRRKIAYTLARMRPAARARLAAVRLRADVAPLVAGALAGGPQ